MSGVRTAQEHAQQRNRAAHRAPPPTRGHVMATGEQAVAKCLSRWLKLRRAYEPERFTLKGRNIRPLLRQAEVELAAAAEDAGYLRKGPIVSLSKSSAISPSEVASFQKIIAALCKTAGVSWQRFLAATQGGRWKGPVQDVAFASALIFRERFGLNRDIIAHVMGCKAVRISSLIWRWGQITGDRAPDPGRVRAIRRLCESIDLPVGKRGRRSR